MGSKPRPGLDRVRARSPRLDPERRGHAIWNAGVERSREQTPEDRTGNPDRYTA
jgi:hypothetical protein